MLRRMEAICGLSVGALVSNSHLMDTTTAEDAIAGLKSVCRAAHALELPVLYGGVSRTLLGEAEKLRRREGISVPLWPLSRYMMLPWEEGAMWSRG